MRMRLIILVLTDLAGTTMWLPYIRKDAVVVSSFLFLTEHPIASITRLVSHTCIS